MKKRKYFIALMILLIFLATIGTVYCAPKKESKKAWEITFLGTLQVPEKLEIVDCKDVIEEMIKFNDKMEKAHPKIKNATNKQEASLEDILAAMEKSNIGIYEFALKDNNTYNTALVFAGKAPVNMNAFGLKYFDKLKYADKKQQDEIHNNILKGLDELYSQVPEVKDMFNVEILEFYPFEQLINKNAQIVSVGGSVAIRTFKLIQPAAFKLYYINKNAEIYIFAVLNSGSDRKLWDDMTKEMLSNARLIDTFPKGEMI